MKDLELGRAINVLAWGSLSVAFVACGGIAESGSGTSEEDPGTPPGTPPTTRASSIATLCEALQECDFESFSREYGTQENCQDRFTEYSEDYTDEYGRACGQAFDEILDCMSESYARTCNPEATSGRCTDEVTQFVTECFQYSDYDYYDYDDYY